MRLLFGVSPFIEALSGPDVAQVSKLNLSL